MGINRWSSSFAKIPWILDSYNLVILSVVQTMAPDMSKILKIFSLDIWLLILLSTLILTLFFVIFNYHKCKHGIYYEFSYHVQFNHEVRRTDFKTAIWIFFVLGRHLLNQPLKRVTSESLLTNIWSFMAFIITVCFSGGILRSIVFREQKNINTFDEMIDSNLTVLTYNNSFVWSQYDSVRNYKQTLDENLKRLKQRLKYFPRDLLFNEVSDPG